VTALVDGVPVTEGLFTWPADEPRLIGSHFPESGAPGISACTVLSR
jgi:hypothetical protein